VNFAITFAKAVTGVDASDFLLSKTGAIAGESVTAVSGCPTVYTVSISTGAGNGTLRLDVPASATITDLSLNPLASLRFTGGETYTINKLLCIFMPLIRR